MSINFTPARATVEALVTFGKDKSVAADHRVLTLQYKDNVPFLAAVAHSDGSFINNLTNSWGDVTANNKPLQSIATYLTEQNAKILDQKIVHDDEWALLKRGVEKFAQDIAESNSKVLPAFKYLYPDIIFKSTVQIPAEVTERINKKATEEQERINKKATEEQERINKMNAEDLSRRQVNDAKVRAENFTAMNQVVTTLTEKEITPEVALEADKQRNALAAKNSLFTTDDAQYKTKFALFSLIVDGAKLSSLGLLYSRPFNYDENIDALNVRNGDEFYKGFTIAIQKRAQGDLKAFIDTLSCKDLIGPINNNTLTVSQLRQAAAAWLKGKQVDNNVEKLILNAVLDYNHSFQSAFGKFCENVPRAVSSSIGMLKDSLKKGELEDDAQLGKLAGIEKNLVDNFKRTAFVKGLTEVKKQLVESFNYQIWLMMKEVLQWPLIKQPNYNDLFLAPLTAIERVRETLENSYYPPKTTKATKSSKGAKPFEPISVDSFLTKLNPIAKNIASILSLVPAETKDGETLSQKVTGCAYLSSFTVFELLFKYLDRTIKTAQDIERESKSPFDLNTLGFSTNDAYFAKVSKDGAPLSLPEIVAASNIFEFTPKFLLQKGVEKVEDVQIREYCAKQTADFTMVITPKGITWDKKDEFVPMKEKEAAPKRPLDSGDEKETGIKKLKTDTVALATAPAVAKEPVVAPTTASVAKK